MAFVRYVVGVEPLACASRETVVAAMAPTLQHYFHQAAMNGVAP